jgi:hypothetical protein
MKRKIAGSCLVLLAVFSAGCLMSPRINLQRLGRIGFLGFDSRTKGNVAAYADQVLLEVLLRAQPGARIVEIGPIDRVLSESGFAYPRPEVLEEIGRRHNLDVILAGTLDLSKVRPRVDLGGLLFGSIQASVDVDAIMSLRLTDIHDGTVFWTDSARVRMDLANLNVLKSGEVLFDARDPERAYGRLIRELILRTTRDLR